MAMAYGEWLKEQREKAGLTQQVLANAATMTRSHIAHIEAGRRWPSEEDARQLDRALNTGNVLSSFLPTGDGAPVADYFENAKQLEQQASMIREFALSYVPGILQTEAYAHAAFRAGFPPMSEETRDRAVVTRLKRGHILADPVTPIVWALLDEAVLRRPIGGPAVMAEQLMHLVDLADSTRIRVHVFPFGVGAHSLLQSMVTLMWFEDQPPIAYVEGLHTGKVHDSPALVERFQGAYDLALGDALPLKESLALLRQTAKDFGHDEQ
ncbi:helix-turn-helix transcriptional regulator [Streptomyces sp. SPB162]|uniref:helix-turn-helix domain-containing protein n=1 Tax=Streptomyces sp. SPB162 TaxID=2940560 RepID=UPI002406AD02|nr:helix-turn-helix transcriptional regulator [Streptomyces sp. SPB162]MDF9815216.1 transcriptional regulator with XRE-family HTH domain [Streptomyces sp. SPB162]